MTEIDPIIVVAVIMAGCATIAVIIMNWPKRPPPR
jgi:hypothetical protein